MEFRKTLNFFKIHLATILLVLFFFSEFLSKYSFYFLDGESMLQRMVKFGVLLFLVIFVARNPRNLIFPVLLGLMFCLGQIFLPQPFIPEIVVSFSKMVFPLFLFTYFNDHPLKKNSSKWLFRTFEYLLIINGFLIFLGFLFELSVFQSYKYGRWGYNGMFITTATSSYVYSIAIFYFLLKYRENFLKNWKTYLVIVSALITGTKILYIAIAASFLIYTLHFIQFKKSHKRILIAGMMVLFLLLGYFFFFQYGIFNDIRKEQGLFSAIFSFRDDLLMEQTLPFVAQNWSWPNYLFGGISDLTTRSQMGFFDIFFFWGILGGLLYLYVFYKCFVTFPLSKTSIYILLILALIVFLAGNFFENASVAIYLLILKERLIKNTSPQVEIR